MVQSSQCVSRRCGLDSPGCRARARGGAWVEAVNSPMFETEVARLRESIRRDRPLGDKIWTLATAKELGLEYSLHPRGRPPKPDRD